MNRPRQYIYLAAGVVDVVLAADVEAGLLQERRQRIADDGAAPVTDVERAGGIGGDVLDVDPPLLPDRGIPIGLAGAQDLLEAGVPEAVDEAQIEKSGARHFGGGDVTLPAQALRQARCQFAGILAGGFRQHHGGVGGEIAVGGIARRLDGDAREIETGGKLAGGDQRRHLGNDALAEMREQIHHGLAYLSKRRACSSRAKRSVMPAM